MLKSAILRTNELDMSCVLGVVGVGGLKEALEEVFILPKKNDDTCEGTGRGKQLECNQ